jgi:hypothetical protein
VPLGTWLGVTPPSDLADHDPFGGDIFPGTPGNVRPPIPAEDLHLFRRAVRIVDHPDIAFVGGAANAVGSLGAVGGDLARLVEGQVDIVHVGPGFDMYTELLVRSNVNVPTPIADYFERSRLDLTPPAVHAKRLASQFISHCASFKVEWALDLRRFDIPFDPIPNMPGSMRTHVVWFDPGRLDDTGDNADPFGELQDLVNGYTPGAPAVADALDDLYDALIDRFTDETKAVKVNTSPDVFAPVFYPTNAVTDGSSGQPDKYFPAALRITVDLFDGNGRFQRPVRHVMVLPVG